MNRTHRTPQLHLSRAVASAAAALLLAAPLAASAQTSAPQMPTHDQISTIESLTNQYFDDVHYGNAAELANLTTPDFHVTYPNGMTIGLDRLIERSTTRNLEESGYEHSTKFDSIVAEGSTIVEHVTASDTANLLLGDQNPTQTETSRRTLTWTEDAAGKWQLASERIDTINQGPFGETQSQ